MTLVAAAACALATGALAANVDVIVQSTDVTLASGDNGTHTADVTLANLRDSDVTVAADVPGDAGCVVDPDPAAVRAGRSSVITLTLQSGCDVDHGTDIELRLGPEAHPSSYRVKAGPPPAEAKVQWRILGWSALIAAGMALVAIGWVASLIFSFNRNQNGPEKTKLGIATPLTGLGTDWSFTDNWVNSVTAGSGVLVALLATSNLLETILGSDPEAALTLMAITGAIAAVLVGISPILVKVFGHDVATPTIAGTLLAALVTLIGSLGQITVVTWQAADLAAAFVRYLIIVLGLLIGAIVFAYAVRALWRDILDGTAVPENSYPDVMKASFVVAAAIRRAALHTQGKAPTGDHVDDLELFREKLAMSAPTPRRYRNSML